MAESQKRDCSSVSLKEKDVLQDLEIGKDFFTSWKSVSMADGDVLDFDLTPVSKGNKKSFEFDKGDLDFNLDGDFGKIPLFNMDMSDLDISPPLKKDGKSKEKPKESSSEKDKRKTDRFAFTFDFDELENFSFDSGLTKESSKAEKDKNNREISPDGSGCQDKEGSMQMNVIENLSTSEEGLKKPSLQETRVTFDMDCLVGGTADLEPTRKTCHSNLAKDAVTTENSATIDDVVSDKAKGSSETTTVSRELPNNSSSKNWAFPGPVDLEACTRNAALQELPSHHLSDNEPSRADSSEAQDKVDPMHKNATGPNGEQDANMISFSGSTSNYKHTLSKNSQHLKTVAISENINNEKSRDGFEDYMIDDRGKNELGQINSHVENTCTTSSVPAILYDSQFGRVKQEHASKIPKVPLASQPADLGGKQTENGREPLVNCSQPFNRPEKPECPLLKVSTKTAFSVLSTKKMCHAPPSLVEGRRDGMQNYRKLVSLPLQYSKTLPSGELPQIRNQESCNGLMIFGELGSADGLHNGKKINDSSATQITDMVKSKSAMRQREMSMKDLDAIRMDINKKAAKNSGNQTNLASVPSTKNTPVEEHSGKTPDLPGLTLKGLILDSTKSPIQKESKSVGKSSQKSILLRKTPPDIVSFLDIQNQTPNLSMKRTLEDAAANIIALHPSKRLFQSASTSRTSLETSQKVLEQKVAKQDHLEHLSKTTIGNSLVTAIHVPHEVKDKEVEITFLIQNDSNIKLADSYSKELDDLCNILRKKHDEAKEILAQAIVNSNKLLMLHSPRFEEKIRATEELLARLKLNSVHG